MELTSIMCPHCRKEHGVREVTVWGGESDQSIIRTEIQEAEFFDTEALNIQEQFKADLEEEYGRPVDFVVGQYSGWCLRPAAE